MKLIERHVRDHTGDIREEFLEILMKDQAKALNQSEMHKWHPMVIRWCLKIYSKSHSICNDIKTSIGLNLPSGRALSNYKNFNALRSGWHSSNIRAMRQRLVDQKAPKHAYLGGLYFHETKIKDGLVFDSSS